MGEFVRVATTDELAPGQLKPVRLNGREICLANVNGECYAFNSNCPHQGGPLCEGTLYDYTLDCPWHHFTYDVRTGENLFPKNVYPASMPQLRRQVIALRTYPVRVENGAILVERP
jgi:3-phenylpropionate/trans-cinnamate dioxygenase ferredoxin component